MGPPGASIAGLCALAAAGLASAPAAPPATATAPVAYRIDPARAEAGFELRVTMHTVHGTTSGVSGEIRVGGEIGGPLALSGRIDVDAASLRTGNASRDKDMRTKSLDVARFSTLSLAPARFVPSGPADATGRVAGSIEGAITIRGVTKPVAIEASLAPGGGSVLAEGRFDVRWGDFGVPDPSFLFLKVDKVAHAHFRAAFVPTGAAPR